MAVPVSIIPELEDAIQHGSPERRVLMLERIANLFIDGAEGFGEDVVGLFDHVLSCLIEEIEGTRGAGDPTGAGCQCAGQGRAQARHR